MDIPMTTGTKMPAILSTSFCTGALLPCASCTIFMICASRVSPLLYAARKLKADPFWLMVPANTGVAGLSLYGQRFAGDHAFIYKRRASGDDLAIDGYLFTGFHQ